jgi:hypothetical protein
MLEGFEKNMKTPFFVISAKAGIHFGSVRGSAAINILDSGIRQRDSFLQNPVSVGLSRDHHA